MDWAAWDALVRLAEATFYRVDCRGLDAAGAKHHVTVLLVRAIADLVSAHAQHLTVQVDPLRNDALVEQLSANVDLSLQNVVWQLARYCHVYSVSLQDAWSRRSEPGWSFGDIAALADMSVIELSSRQTTTFHPVQLMRLLEYVVTQSRQARLAKVVLEQKLRLYGVCGA